LHPKKFQDFYQIDSILLDDDGYGKVQPL